MIATTAIGRVVNPKFSGKVLNFALETSKPSSSDKQLISVTIFINQNSRVQEYIKQNSQVAVQGRLELGDYQGKKTVRIVSNSSSVQLLGGGSRSGSGDSSPRSQESESKPRTTENPSDVVDSDVIKDTGSAGPAW